MQERSQASKQDSKSKAPGQKPRALQVARHKILMGLGFRVYVIDGTEKIGGVIREIQST